LGNSRVVELQLKVVQLRLLISSSSREPERLRGFANG